MFFSMSSIIYTISVNDLSVVRKYVCAYVCEIYG